MMAVHMNASMPTQLKCAKNQTEVRPETIRELPLCTKSEATIFPANNTFLTLTMCALMQTMCPLGHIRIDA